MEVLGFAEARARLGELMEAIVADHIPVAMRDGRVERSFWSPSPTGERGRRRYTCCRGPGASRAQPARSRADRSRGA